MSFINTHFKRIIQRDLLLLNPNSSVYSLKPINKVILNCAEEETDEKFVLSCFLALYVLSSQKPYRAINKVKEKVVGGKVTLRKKHMYNFIDRFLFECLPNIKSAKKLKLPVNEKSYYFNIVDFIVFDELATVYSYIEEIKHIGCQINFNQFNVMASILMGQSLLFCFKDN